MLKPFNIVFYKGKTPIAKIIKMLTKSKYSHVAMLIDDFHLIQLDWKTPISIQHLSYQAGSYDIYELTVELTHIEKELILNYIRERMNTSYDWKLIFSRFFNILFGTPIISSIDKYNCDELIVEALRSISVNLIADDVKMTPDTLSKSKLLKQIK